MALQMNPNCKCGVPSELQTVKKDGDNTGRPFYCCSRRRDDVNHCGFFSWAGPAPARARVLAVGETNSGFQPASSIPAPSGQVAALGQQIQLLMKRVDVLEDKLHTLASVQTAPMDQ